jgi:hypothetical protein
LPANQSHADDHGGQGVDGTDTVAYLPSTADALQMTQRLEEKRKRSGDKDDTPRIPSRRSFIRCG